jgi:hypothetical protein
MTTPAPFEVARLTRRCAATGRELAVGEAYIASLAGGDTIERRDYSLEAWEGGVRPAGTLVGWWRGVVPAPETKGTRLVSDPELLDLFEQLAETTDPARQAFAYVLALLLTRRRLLKLEPGGRAALRVRRAGEEGAPIVEVRDPGLDETRLNEVIEQLGQVIEGAPA